VEGLVRILPRKLQKGKATEGDVGRTERPVGEKEPGSSLSPATIGKATEPTDTVESVSHTPALVLPAEVPATPVQQRSSPLSPSPCSALRFNAFGMATGGPSIPIPMVRQIRVPGKETPRIADPPIDEWTEGEKTMYQRAGVQMVLKDL
jgi:hypothetical protein